MDLKKLNYIKKSNRTYNEERISAQIGYAHEWSLTHGGAFENEVETVVDFVYESICKGVSLSDAVLNLAEQMLEPIAKEIKKQTIFCCAHAHMDMAWKWGYPETVSVVISTVRTILSFFEKYPNFKYSQSQASTYKILEEHAPEMIEKIKKLIKEGRWEVSGCSWVEADKNMPNAEDCIRQITHAKNYLSNLLDIPVETLDIDFEPDTFGHSAAIPEILAQCGVKYYYHCRGNQGPVFSRWISDSRKSILVYREPIWYNAYIYYNEFSMYPALMAKYGLNGFLKVYGVGDHGGGPTRRDIERLIDMNTWPCMPNIKFSTYHEFFEYAEKNCVKIENSTGEKNYIFSGCYTSQSRIKQGNKIGEIEFKKVDELLASALINCGNDVAAEKLNDAWQNHLFNQFHDILPGSGVTDSREYAMGLYQERDACLGAIKTNQLIKLSQNVNSNYYFGNENVDTTTAEGAGVGFTSNDGIYAGCVQGGKTRLYLAYNDSDFGGETLVKILLWDYFDVQLSDMVIQDVHGNNLKYQVLNVNPIHFYSHYYYEIVVKCKVPAHGYTYLKVCEGETGYISQAVCDSVEFRQHSEQIYKLENDVICAEFDNKNARLKTITDKRNKKVYFVNSGLKYAVEDAKSFLPFPDAEECMTAWVVGRYLKSYDVSENVNILNYKYVEKGLLKQFVYTGTIEKSKFEMCVSLGIDEFLRFDLKYENRDFGEFRVTTPSLLFNAHTDAEKFAYTHQLGLIERKPLSDDQVSQDGIFALKDSGGLYLYSDTKYGYRAENGEISVNLLRNTTDPDLYPEVGEHKISITLAPLVSVENFEIYNVAKRSQVCIDTISVLPSKGTLPLEYKTFSRIENVFITHLKKTNNDKGVIVRLLGGNEKDKKAIIETFFNFKSVKVVDCLENELSKLNVKGNLVELNIQAGELINLYFEF